MKTNTLKVRLMAVQVKCLNLIIIFNNYESFKRYLDKVLKNAFNSAFLSNFLNHREKTIFKF